MTRAYLLSVLDDELIEEHRAGNGRHPSEPLARFLAWCQRRPLTEQYAVKAEADGAFRLVCFSGRRGQPPHYIGDERYTTLREARHGAFLRHVKDLTET
jgi:branched-chain amino acid transport system permease protein